MALTSPETSGLGEMKERVVIHKPDVNKSKAACMSLKTFHETQRISFIFVIFCQNTLLAIILKHILNTCISCSVDDVGDVAC